MRTILQNTSAEEVAQHGEHWENADYSHDAFGGLRNSNVVTSLGVRHDDDWRLRRRRNGHDGQHDFGDERRHDDDDNNWLDHVQLRH